jgi:cell division protein FtsI (penicillin-binding protein 3)
MNNSRALLIIGFVFILFVGLIFRLFDIQILKSDELKFYAQRQQMHVEKIRAERGLIYDRNNVLLVYNRNDVSFYLDLRMVKNKQKKKIAAKFSSVFGKSKNHYFNLMKGSGRTICLEKKASSENAQLLKNFKVRGLFYKNDPTRVYYYNDLAANVLGYVGNNYKGVDDIEKSFNNVLSGEDGSMLILRDAVGDMITVAEEKTKPAVTGDNIYLTINKTYQTILEEELKNGLKKYKGTSDVGIIMDPNNGQVLAMACMDNFDPNEYWKYSNEERRDKAVTDTYEPGSTFKTFSMASLLDKNLCRLNENIYVNDGRYKFKNVTITDDHKNKWLTARGVIEESSNIGMSKLIERIDNDSYYKYLRAFGFGNYTSINLPGEVRGTLRTPNKWTPIMKAFMSFGYGVTVTPIQLITAYSAVVNGGILYQPEILLKETKHDGQLVFQNQPKMVRRVISERTSERMRNLLVGVVKDGTGTNAQLSSITVGGKTGTSQKLIDGKYSKTMYNSSFVGFFPAESPKVVCLILVNSPEVGRYGGSVAAPIFKNVAERIVALDPNYFQNPNQYKHENKSELKVMFVSDKKNGSKYNSENIIPASKQADIKKLNQKVMPNLKNFSIREAITLLSKLKLRYKVNGSGKVVEQSIEPGTQLRKGLTCILNCKESITTGAIAY